MWCSAVELRQSASCLLLCLQVKNALVRLYIDQRDILGSGSGGELPVVAELRRLNDEALQHVTVVAGIYEALQQDFFRDSDVNAARAAAKALQQRIVSMVLPQAVGPLASGP